MTDSFIDNLNDIDAVAVDDDAIAAYTSEDQFNALTVELLKEVGSFVCVAACILPADKKHWSRDQAIYGGHLVRLFKLTSALLDQICQKRRETTFILSRLAFETLVNLAYFIEYGSLQLFDEYIRYSLRQEKRLYDRIMANIAARDGIRLPIEDRMLSSISAAATKSGFSIVDLSPSEPKNWGERIFVSEQKLLGLRSCTSLPLAEDRRIYMEIGWTYSNIISTKKVTDSPLAWSGTGRDLKLVLPSHK